MSAVLVGLGVTGTLLGAVAIILGCAWLAEIIGGRMGHDFGGLLGGIVGIAIVVGILAALGTAGVIS